MGYRLSEEAMNATIFLKLSAVIIVRRPTNIRVQTKVTFSAVEPTFMLELTEYFQV